MLKIAIVNDNTTIRDTLALLVRNKSSHEVIWTAENGQEAVDKCTQQLPDLILMDLIMPIMNGVDATRIIMQDTPCGILIVTASVSENADMAFTAMAHGALDAVSTPVLDLENFQSANNFIDKLEIIEKLISNDAASTNNNVESTKGHQPLVCIGASTGGPGALAKILADIPANIPASIVIVQHVDKNFTSGLADWLGSQSNIPMSEAVENTHPEPGHAYIAGGDQHLVLDKHGYFRFQTEPAEYPYRPSIDIFFNSVAINWHGDIIGVLLTGMGNDGAQGLLSLKQQSAITITQDKDSCAVFGMPAAAIKLNAAQKVLPLDAIGNTINYKLSKSQESHK